jgi:hypothetical protein
MVLFAVFLWLQAERSVTVKPVTVCETLLNETAYKGRAVAVVGRLERSVSLIDSTEYLAQDACGAGTASRILIWADLDPADGPEPPKEQPNLDSRVLASKLAKIRKTTALGTHVEPRYKKVENRITFSHFADVPNEWAVVYGKLVKIPEEGEDGVRLSLVVVRQNVQILDANGTLRQPN